MKMKEYGSDFHYVDSYNSGRAHLTDVFRGAVLLADGRQCIVALLRQYGWKRLWMPDYFCYEVIETIKLQTGVEVCYYADNPLHEGAVGALPYKEGDVLLRMNYFGMRDLRSNKDIPVPVIEDHSHDPFGHWALYSDADWCISSLRKTLPLPVGGMMWSPKQHKVDTSELKVSVTGQEIAAQRWLAMEMKAGYLRGEDVEKGAFRKILVGTEDWFDSAEPELMDDRSREFVTQHFDLNLWLGAKRMNWTLLKELLSQDDCELLTAEHESCTMFSAVLVMKNKEHRDALRKRLIENCIYPAILWNVPETASEASKRFSELMLSIHCDGRYDEEDVRQMADIINKAIEESK